MSKQDNGGPAFPCDAIEERNSMGKLQGRAISGPGISIRDYFAAKAMQAMVSSDAYCNGLNGGWGQDDIASQSYSMADAMLAERVK